MEPQWFEVKNALPPELFDVVGLAVADNGAWEVKEVYLCMYGWSDPCSMEPIDKRWNIVAWTWKPELPQPTAQLLFDYTRMEA